MARQPHNVVFLSQRVPHPPDRGDRISTHHILRHLRELGCRLRVGCFAEDDRDEQAAAELAGMVDEVAAPRINPRARKILSLRGMLTGEALTLPYFRHSGLQRTVDGWLAQDPPDLVFLYSSSMAQFVRTRDDLPRIMHFAELDSDKWRQYSQRAGPLGRFVYGRESRRLLQFETEIAHRFSRSLVVSEIERELFEQLIPGVSPAIIPNGVDVDHFATAPDAARDPHTLIFTGVMDYEPNVDGVLWFVERCWPDLRRRFPDARFLVVGNRPIAQIRELDGKDGIVVTGWVETTPPWFDRASVAIAPLRLARGLQNKVLEAMSMGLPVVSSPQAAQGLGEVPADTLLVEADIEQLGARVAELFDATDRACEIGARAAAFVRSEFRWENMFERLDVVFDEALGGDPRVAATP